jgi:hypothetical protein
MERKHMSDQLPDNVMREMEEKNILVGERITRDNFDRLSPLAAMAVVKAGVLIHDQIPPRQFERYGSLERRDFLARGGRVVEEL